MEIPGGPGQKNRAMGLKSSASSLPRVWFGLWARLESPAVPERCLPGMGQEAASQTCCRWAETSLIAPKHPN